MFHFNCSEVVVAVVTEIRSWKPSLHMRFLFGNGIQ